MSDFLTRLAARQLGVMPAVSARVPALYEPLDTGDSKAVSPGAGEIAEETPRATAESTAVGRRASSGREETDDVATGVESRSPLAVGPDQRPLPVLQSPVLASPDVEMHAHTQQSGTTSRTSLERSGTVSSHQALLEHVSATTPRARRTEPRPQAGLRETNPEPPAAALLPAEATVAHAQQPSTRIADRTPQIPPLVEPLAPVEAFGIVRFGPQVSPRPAARANPDGRTRSSLSADPVVHVSIGRIEVTAVTAVAPAKRPARAPKSSSLLDEYLARCQRKR